MPLDLPNLDDRTFDTLVADARELIGKKAQSSWTDLSPGDPGIVLLEAFAFLTEQMLYRLNRLPEKAYIAFLRLLGVTLQPPTAAHVALRFTRNPAGRAEPVTLPMGTRVAAAFGDGGAGQLVFVTENGLALGPGQTAEVIAYQCEWEEEDLGVSQGVAGQVFRVSKPPIVAPVGNKLDVMVGVRLAADEKANDGDWLAADEYRYRPWVEVDDFAETDGRSGVYMVDRLAGTIHFAPDITHVGQDDTAADVGSSALNKAKDRPKEQDAPTAERRRLRPNASQLGAVPKEGRVIRVRYAHGGGEAGNLPRGQLNQLLSGPHGQTYPDVTVTNGEPATGGMDAEPLANALVRGPYSVFARKNVVTARDFEQVARRRGRSIARAKAYARHAYWKHARPGTVEIALVPYLARTNNTPVTEAQLKAAQLPVDLDPVKADLQRESVLGVNSQLVWARYKQVTVNATIEPGEHPPDNWQGKLVGQLNSLISPLNLDKDGAEGGWSFGQELPVARVHREILETLPGSLVRQLSLEVEHAPQADVRCLAPDHFQPRAWYAGSGGQVFRSINDGAGWELVLELGPQRGGELHFPNPEAGETAWTPALEAVTLRMPWRVAVLRPNPQLPGMVAMAAVEQGPTMRKRSGLYLSPDCGENWYCLNPSTSYEIRDMAWMLRPGPRGAAGQSDIAGQPVLLLATSTGLQCQEITLTEDGAPDWRRMTPTPVEVVPGYPDLPLNAVTVLCDGGRCRLAVAAANRLGVFISRTGDMPPPPKSFDLLGLEGEDIRTLGVQNPVDGTVYLWAGAMAIGSDLVRGCYCWRYDQLQLKAEALVNEAWNGGSCYGLAFLGSRVLAATAAGGVLAADMPPNFPAALPVWRPQGRAGRLPKRLSWLDQQGNEHKQQSTLSALFALGATQQGETQVVLVGGENGVYRWQSGGDDAFEYVSEKQFTDLNDAVTLPINWLLVSGTHDVRPPGKGAVAGQLRQTPAAVPAAVEGPHAA